MYAKAAASSRSSPRSPSSVAVGFAACDIAVDGEGGLHFDVAAGKAQDEWIAQLHGAAGGRFELVNVNGDIRPRPTTGEPGNPAERTAKAPATRPRKELLGKVEMREEVGDTRVRIETRPPRLRGRRGMKSSGRSRCRGAGGRPQDRQRRSEADRTRRATSAPGRPTAGSPAPGCLSSAVDAVVTNGGVEIELASAPTTGQIELESVNGGVSLTLPGDSKADIAARCVNGGITVHGLESSRRRGDQAAARWPVERRRRAHLARDGQRRRHDQQDERHDLALSPARPAIRLNSSEWPGWSVAY